MRTPGEKGRPPKHCRRKGWHHCSTSKAERGAHSTAWHCWHRGDNCKAGRQRKQSTFCKAAYMHRLQVFSWNSLWMLQAGLSQACSQVEAVQINLGWRQKNKKRLEKSIMPQTCHCSPVTATVRVQQQQQQRAGQQAFLNIMLNYDTCSTRVNAHGSSLCEVFLC